MSRRSGTLRGRTLVRDPGRDEFLEDHKSIREALHGCHFPSDDYAAWENARGFIDQAIDRSGTILDLGCANGFLLKSLRHWSNHELVPFGLDPNAFHIEECEQHFPGAGSHFAHLPIERFDARSRYGLPDRFDLIYWNVWDDYEFNQDQPIRALHSIFDSLSDGGRLILGFYHPDAEWVQRRISQIESRDLGDLVARKNPHGPQTLFWLDKK